MTTSPQVAIIGLGTMGANFARNMLSHHLPLVVYNRTEEILNEFLASVPEAPVEGIYHLREIASKLHGPRIIFLVVTAGPAVDMILQELLPTLSAGDIIVDCGNSHYKDTQRREQEAQKHHVSFVGCGLSGGEEGALRGPSLMAGGTPATWMHLAPVLETVAARDFTGGSCAARVGSGPAGHYVKMLHNGIEYAIMGVLAEFYEMYRDGYGLTTPELADVFTSWNHGPLTSFLMEASIHVLRQPDVLADGFVIDHILDSTAQKGTGLWSTQEGLERTIPIPSISASVFQRIVSQHKAARVALGNVYGKPVAGETHPNVNGSDALEAAILLIFAQGLAHLQTVSLQEHWEIDLAEVCRIWQGGCIIRMELLKNLREVMTTLPEEGIMAHPWMQERLKATLPALRQLIQEGVGLGIPIPVSTSTLAYYDGMIKAYGSGNFLQGLRDYFGAHTYQRTDREGVFHTEWL